MYFQMNLLVFLFATFCCIGGQVRNGNRDSSEPKVDWEVARQNRITQQILQYYLERKLFPQLKRPSSRVPSASDILSRVRKNYNYDKIQSKLNVTRRREQETLQSVESETVTAVFDQQEEGSALDEDEGRHFYEVDGQTSDERPPLYNEYESWITSDSE